MAGPWVLAPLDLPSRRRINSVPLSPPGEMVNAADLKSAAFGHTGSSPVAGKQSSRKHQALTGLFRTWQKACRDLRAGVLLPIEDAACGALRVRHVALAQQIDQARAGRRALRAHGMPRYERPRVAHRPGKRARLRHPAAERLAGPVGVARIRRTGRAEVGIRNIEWAFATSVPGVEGDNAGLPAHRKREHGHTLRDVDAAAGRLQRPISRPLPGRADPAAPARQGQPAQRIGREAHQTRPDRHQSRLRQRRRHKRDPEEAGSKSRISRSFLVLFFKKGPLPTRPDQVHP